MTKLKFHYIKAPDYREVAVHGAFGGLQPTGDGVFLSVYSERPPIPQATFAEVTDDGTLGPELVGERESREGVVRVVQFGMYLTRENAVAIRDWLDVRISKLDEVAGNGDAAA